MVLLLLLLQLALQAAGADEAGPTKRVVRYMGRERLQRGREKEREGDS